MKINLLPDLVLKRRREARIKQMAAITLVAWVGLVVVACLGAVVYQQAEKSALKSKQTEEKQLDARVNSADNKQFRTQALEVQASLAALDQLINHQHKMSLIISGLASMMPHDVVLGDIELQGSDKLQISGTAPSYLEAGKFEAALKDSQKNSLPGQVYFTSVELGGATMDDKGVHFSLTTGYVYPATVASNGGQS